MSTKSCSSTGPLANKPQNGLAGLQHWRADLLAGFVVSLVSLPLSSGIAIASGAPPIYGIVSSIIAGLVYPFVKGSFVTISGPAAGLAPALVAIMTSLGGVGDADHVGAGYHKLLVVIFLVGLIQIVIARFKLAKYAAVFPAAVVEGMLAAIGVLITVKAIPLFIGFVDSVHAHGFVEYLQSVPSWVQSSQPEPAVVGGLTLVVMFLVGSTVAQRIRAFKVIPPHLWGVLIAVPAALVVGLEAMDARYLIQVPENPISGISFPAFGEVFADASVWGAVAMGTLTLLLIDGVESLATAQAIDRVDPYKRTSDPDRVLRAMGLSNMISSLLGGLTVIPGGVKSKTNIEAGGRTLWSNFVNACCLLAYLFLIPSVVALIPKAALGGILIYTGWKMAHPSLARHMAKVGKEQLALFIVTIIATVLTDLLIGVIIGTALKFMILAYYSRYEVRRSKGKLKLGTLLRGMFRDPVVEEVSEDGETLILKVDKPLVCFNSFRLREHLINAKGKFRHVRIHIEPEAAVIDHTACGDVLAAADLMEGQPVHAHGLQEMQTLGNHEASIRLQQTQILQKVER